MQVVSRRTAASTPKPRAVKLLNALAEVCHRTQEPAAVHRAVLVAAQLHAAGRAAQGAHAVGGDGPPAKRLAAADHRWIVEASRITPIQLPA
jgi:hypothetical protein